MKCGIRPSRTCDISDETTEELSIRIGYRTVTLAVNKHYSESLIHLIIPSCTGWVVYNTSHIYVYQVSLSSVNDIGRR
jgi:hypothetical protein